MNVRAWVEGRWLFCYFEEATGSLTPLTKLEPSDSVNLLVPGLVDHHCHGIDGFDVMEGGAVDVGSRLRQRGIEYWCPTTVTADWRDVRRAIETSEAAPGFAGIHLEGPFLNAARLGAQSREHLRRPSWHELTSELGALIEQVRIVTLAPELDGGRELCSALEERGITASAGHTDATYAELAEANTRRMTHFYNAMRPLDHREPGCIGYGLSSNADVELIYDRVHVGHVAAGIAFKCARNVLAVSDGTAMSGTPEGTTRTMWSREVKNERGSARLPDGTLAGSSSTLADVFTNVWEDFGAETAVACCSEVPRRALGLPRSRLWLLVEPGGTIIRVIDMEVALA